MSLTTLRNSEPVRLFLYPALVTVLGILVVKGAVTQEWSDLIVALAGAFIGIPVVEAARANAVSPKTAADVVTEALREPLVPPNVPVLPDLARLLSRVGIRVPFIK